MQLKLQYDNMGIFGKEEKLRRLNSAYKKLKEVGAVHLQVDFAKVMGRNHKSISNAFSGNERFLTDRLIFHIEKKTNGIIKERMKVLESMNVERSDEPVSFSPFKDNLRKAMDQKGVSSGIIGENTSVKRQSIDAYLKGASNPTVENIRILSDYLEVSTDFLIKGQKGQPVLNFDFKGNPYYNVDFIGGFDLVLNDQTVNPDYYVDFFPFNKEGVIWCNLHGKSMEPYIFSGDKIVIKEVQVEDVIYGKVYGIVTCSGMRTVKWVTRSPDNECVRLMPENKDPKFGDFQDLPKKDIMKMFELIAAIRAF